MRDTKVMWGLHVGKTGDAEALFLKKGRIAVGWVKAGDLRKVGPDREAVKKVVAEAYPDKKPAGVSVSAGQLFRFANEIKVGDWVAYPSKADRHVHIGRVEGDYVWDPKVEPGYPHQRAVKWLGAVPRTKLTQGRDELGSAISLFQVKNYRDEIIAAVQGKPTVIDVEKDPTVKVVVEEIEESTRDFVLKCLSTDLKGHPLPVSWRTCWGPWATTPAFRQKDRTGVSTSSPTRTSWASSPPSSRFR